MIDYKLIVKDNYPLAYVDPSFSEDNINVEPFIVYSDANYYKRKILGHSYVSLEAAWKSAYLSLQRQLIQKLVA